MKKASLIAIILCSVFSLKSEAQATRTDTLKNLVPCVYVTDSASFKIGSGWLRKVVTSTYQFAQPQVPNGVDSFTVHKEWIPSDTHYYAQEIVSGIKVWRKVPILFEFKYPSP